MSYAPNHVTHLALLASAFIIFLRSFIRRLALEMPMSSLFSLSTTLVQTEISHQLLSNYVWNQMSMLIELLRPPPPRSCKGPCHAFPVITRPLVRYEGCSACKRAAESQTLKVHPVESKTLTQKDLSLLPQNASLDISLSPLFTSWVLWRVNTQINNKWPDWPKWTNPWSPSHTRIPWLTNRESHWLA